MIDRLVEFNDSKKRSDAWTFWYKPLDYGAYKFKLSYEKYYWRSPTYRASYLKGTIRNTKRGCIIEAEKRFNIDNIFVILMLCLCYTMAIGVIAEDISSPDFLIILPIMVFLGVSVALFWFLYTRKERLKKDEHINIIDLSAECKCTRVM
jgi:hypothetical protein